MEKQQHTKIMAFIIVMAVIVCGQQGVEAMPMRLTLEQSIERALEFNPVVYQGLAQVEGAKAKLNQAQANFGPQLSFSATAAPTSSVTGLPPLIPLQTVQYNYYENEFQLSLPLYSGGKLENQLDQQHAEVTVSEKNLSNTKEQLVLDTTLTYINVLESQKLLALTQESYDNTNKHLHNVKERFVVGVAIRTDILRSEVELANITQDLIKARNACKLNLLTLNSLLKLPLATELELPDIVGSDIITTPSVSVDECVKTALAIHPQLIGGKAGIASARYAFEASKSGRRPTLTLFGYYDWAESDRFPPHGDNWQVGLSMNFNVLDSGLIKGQVRQSKATLEETEARYQKLQDDMVLEVQQAWFNLMEAKERSVAAQMVLEKAQEDYHMAEERYEVGVGTNIDVLDAQEALVKSRTNYIQSEYDVVRDQAKLSKAVGKRL